MSFVNYIHFPTGDTGTTGCLTLRQRRIKVIAKSLAQCQVVCGLLCFSFGALYWSHRGGLRDFGTGLWCGLYFMFSGMLGVFALATERSALTTAYTVVSLHAALLFVPALVITNAFGAYVEQQGCFYSCTSRPSFQCELICQAEHNWNLFSGLSNHVADLGLILLGLIELLFSILSVVVTLRCGKDLQSATTSVYGGDESHSISQASLLASNQSADHLCVSETQKLNIPDHS